MYNLEYKRKYVEKNRDKINEQNREYRQKNKNKTIAWHKKSRDVSRFGGLRIQVLLRDKWKCVFCGMTNEEHIKTWKREISIDHIDGDRSNNTLGNLQTCCLRCHGKKDIRRKRNWGLLSQESRNKMLIGLRERWNGRR